MRNTDDMILGFVCFAIGLLLGLFIERHQNED